MLQRMIMMFLFLSSFTWPRAYGEHWSEFRGPTGQGLSTAKRLPTMWDGTTNVTWKKRIPGKGWSSPILYEGRIYMTTAVSDATEDDGDQSLRVVCLDAVSGKSLWSVQAFHQSNLLTDSIHRKNSHASPTPLTDGEHLYVHFGTNGTACLDMNGNVVWRSRELQYAPQHGTGGSPVLVGQSLVMSCDGLDVQFVAALDRNTGKNLWRTTRPSHSGRGFSFSTPLVIDINGERQVVSAGSGHVCSYDPDDGREIWRVEYPGGYSVVPRPLYGHGLVFVCSGYGTPVLFAIRPDGTGDVTDTHVVWSTKSRVPHNPSPLLVGGELYFVSDKGVATCLDAKTGKLHWQQRLGGGGDHSASPVYADGRIYFQNEDGDGTVIKAHKQYVELSRNSLGERTLASYAIGDGTIFIRSLYHLYRIDGS